MIQKHENKYIHFPKLAILPLIGTIFFGILSWLNLYLINGEVVKFVFECTEEECKNISVDALINLLPISIEYILISLTIISIVAIFKGGYSRLKSYDEKGFENGFIFELIFGFIFGIIFGMIFAMIIGMIYGIIFGMIIGMIFAMIYGIIVGMIRGLIYELNGELEFNWKLKWKNKK